MHSNLRKGLFLVTLLGAAIPVMPVMADDMNQMSSGNMPGVGIEAVLNDCYSQNKEIKVEDYLVPSNKGEYLDMAFADVTSFLYIRSQPTKESEYVGKLYPGYAAKIVGPVGEWTAVVSGEVTGYVKTEYITIGQESEQIAEELVEKAESEGREDPFTYAESREQEEARLKAEAEAKAEEEARERAIAEAEAKEKASGGQAVVAYACQFIGNPYVWGGTSLTNGADCSGFVQSVFAHFGITLPRTSYEQRSAGVGVSYEEAIPGDLICYDGHVGIYIGNGQIVNAMNPAQGIGISPATYTNILAVRRVL
ncbi:MAG: C40 family peptidase [Bariatricus sp.]